MSNHEREKVKEPEQPFVTELPQGSIVVLNSHKEVTGVISSDGGLDYLPPASALVSPISMRRGQEIIFKEITPPGNKV